MSFINIRLEHHEEKLPPVLWLISFFAHIVALLFCLMLVIGPFILLVKSFWFGLLFIFIPAGYRMGKKVLQTFKKHIWKNRHTSVYRIDPEYFYYEKSDPTHLTVEKSNISLQSINYIVVSQHIFRDEPIDQRIKVYEEITQISTYPSFHIVGSRDGETVTVHVPFNDSYTINHWLQQFKEKNIPFFYTPLPVHEVDEQTRLKILARDDNVISFTFEHDWETHREALEDEWNEKVGYDEQVLKELPEINMDEDEEQKHGIKEGEVKRQRRMSFGQWANLALKAYTPLAIGTGVAIWLAHQGMIDEEGIMPGIYILFISSFIYFKLLNARLRWFHMIRYCIEAFIIIIIIFLGFDDMTDAGEEMLTSILASSMLFIAIAWIPYLIAKQFANKKSR